MRIAFFEVEKWEKDKYRTRLRDIQLMFFGETINETVLDDLRDLQGICVFIYSQLTQEILKNFSDLKLVATRSTGFDHIDLEFCRKRKIHVVNVPFYGENTVAEHTFALILALSRNVHKAYCRTIRQDFSLEDLQGFDLKHKTLGVIGCGKIGLHVIRIAKGFGMEVLVYDTKREVFLQEVLGYKYVSFEELLKSSDVISLHVPYNEKTHHMINKEVLKKVKKGAILINTARGGLVETEALIWALDQGIIGGAGLDVLEGEEFMLEEGYILKRDYSKNILKTFVQNQILLRREDVVITPHNAFNSREATLRILDTTCQNILKFIKGNPQNIVV